ncbi:MAG TPA: Na+/H+ antiporter subunit E [Gammaproteobacteria bacterium]|nr:Na+/H+ antiporter subunit E [Gammaproteobacteria bacterium]
MKAAARTAARAVPPVLTGMLLVMWLLLNDSLSLGHVLLGLSLAVVLAWSSGVLRPLQPRIRRAQLALVLFGLVLLDIVQSNLAVARIVLGLRKPRPGFLKIPLDLTDPHGLAVLAGIVTATPGTVWVDHDAVSSTLTLHVLDLKSEQEWIDWIKNRYERLLLGVFE